MPNSGTASSAAAEGVGARRSAAKSVKEKSISWPTAEITGRVQSCTAATTISSLKAHRSSKEPPPRPTISTSQRRSRSAWRMAAAISPAAFSPWTATGYNRMGMLGNRRAITLRMSSMAAPVPEVTTPTARGRKGMGFFKLSSNQPRPLSSSRRAINF